MSIKGEYDHTVIHHRRCRYSAELYDGSKFLCQRQCIHPCQREVYLSSR